VVTLLASLKKHDINAGALHGDMSQPARMETLERFKQGEIRILVASDVAARGLDIVDMSHVFNFDVPFSPEDYVHRIGRTGRAGKTGHSFTLASPSEGDLVQAIEKLIGTTIPRIEVPGLDLADFEASDGRRRGRGRGRGGRTGDKSRGPRREAREPREHHERKPRPAAEPQAEARAEQHEPREHAAREQAPREHAPREQRPRERKPREHGPREHGPREHGPREQGPREHAPREHRAEQHRPQRERKPDQRPERRDRRQDGRDEPAPVGLGDHVPAFLARLPR
jgi:superfamily II DNA/RNA helicase